ncbi:MAG: hypothetical protein KF812_04845 [Fimbriimonadaceae bacterium]|nr:hypothetical protein [Fimbriimonadaceae bacterium]
MNRFRFLALGIVASSFAAAQTVPVEVTFDLPVFNKYVWRGANLSNGAVLQPSLTFGLNGWNLVFWGNYELTNTNGNRGRFDEIDTDLSFSGESGHGAWTLGFIYYDFPNTGAAPTSEVYGQFAFARDWTPTVSAYFDVDQADGFYLNLEASRTMEGLTFAEGIPAIDFTYGAAVGYGDKKHNNFYYNNNDSGLTDWRVFGNFNFAGSRNGAFYVNTAFTGFLDGDQLRGARNRNNFVVGAGYAMKF